MPWCRRCEPFRPVRQYTAEENGKPMRCAVFCMGRGDVPRLLRWLRRQKAPLLGLRREDDRVTVQLGAQTEEDGHG